MGSTDPTVAAESKPSCGKGIEVPSERERKALASLKSIKERVRVLKKRLSSLSASGTDENTGEILDLKEQLASLKSEWDRWEVEKQDAARERMILLGHESP